MVATAERWVTLPITDALGPRDDPVGSVLAVIPEWWSRLAQQAGISGRWQDWRLAMQAPPVSLALQPMVHLVDGSADEISAAYLAASDPSVRQREGRHYTPETLVDTLWNEIARLAPVTSSLTFDPACGTGALLRPRLRQLIQDELAPDVTLRLAGDLIRGTDLDAAAVWLGNAMLCAELLPVWARIRPEARRPLPQLLTVGDGLVTLDDLPGIIVMNPPYGRIQLSPGERQRWARSLYGHSNRYALFLHAAIERAAPNGIIAAVLPTSFLGGNYYQRLRSMIAEQAPLCRLVFIQERVNVFAGDVLQETCLAVFRKQECLSAVRCSRLTLNGNATFELLPESRPPTKPYDKPWLLPRRAEDGPLIRRATCLRSRLRDYGWKVSTGPLVWNRHKEQIGPLSDGAAPVLWAADLLGGRVHRDSARNHQRWIRLRERDQFMLLREPAVLVQRTTAPEQPRRLVASLLDEVTLATWGGAVVVENHVNVLRCHRPDGVLTPVLLVALLNTSAIDRLYRCLTGSVAVSAYELEAIPLPDSDTVKSWQILSSGDLARTAQEYFLHGTA